MPLGRGDLVPRDLLLHCLEDARAKLVLELLGLEALDVELLDELPGHLDLRGLERDFVPEIDFREVPHLVCVEELMHDQPVLVGANQDEVALAPRHVTAERHLARLAHRLRQQPVGLVPTLVRTEIVGLLDVYEVDGAERHELEDLEIVCFLFLQGLELLGIESNVLALRILIALDHVRPIDDLVVHWAINLVPDAIAALVVELVEADSFRAGGRIELERNRYEPEGQRSGADGARGHRIMIDRILRLAKH